MIPFRLQVKFFLENPDALELTPFIGIFQRWIQQNTLQGAGQLVDVADYGHVVRGPGVVLIGHETDFGLDLSEGRAGLLLTRKHQTDQNFQDQLRNSIRLALTAAQLIESEPLPQRLKFRTDEIEFRFLDRLQLPNKPESFDLVRDDLKTVLADIYGDTAINLASVNQDARYLFTVSAHGQANAPVETLLERLQVTVK